MSEERTFEIRLPEGRVFVRYRGRPDDLKFSVMLQAQTVGGWRTICLIDNAEGKGTHIHRYEGTRKLPAQPFHQGSAREGVPAAHDFLREHARGYPQSMAKRPLGAAAERALGAMDTEMLSETHRWPDGAVVIPSDLPEFGVAVADAVEGRAPFVLVFPDGQEIMFRPIPQATGDIDLSSTLDALRRLGPLTSPHVPVDLQAYGVSVAATSALYEPPVAA